MVSELHPPKNTDGGDENRKTPTAAQATRRERLLAILREAGAGGVEIRTLELALDVTRSCLNQDRKALRTRGVSISTEFGGAGGRWVLRAAPAPEARR